jgi:hypothetical protein
VELADWHMWWKRSGARELRQLLMEEWDPIHVRGVPGAADEYDAYLPRIVARLRDGATAEDIAAYLTDIEEVQMGLGPSAAGRERNQTLAGRLRSWYAEATAAGER